MARVTFLAAILTGACQGADLPDAFLGTWSPIGRTVEAILGPVGVPTLTMTKGHGGDHWISYIPGQVFRVRENVMEYCFAHVVSSPFVVDTVEDNLIRFCYKTGDRMATHKVHPNGTLATGCDAAKIEMELHDNGNLEFTFWMSPPVRHAWAVYKRVGPGPPVATYIAAGGTCDPLHPGPPTLGGPLDASMCPVVNHKKKQLELAMSTAERSEVQDDGEALEAGFGKSCRKLDGGLLGIQAKGADKVDIKLEHSGVGVFCWPCKVSYSVSAKIAEDEYIALGFKGMAYRALGLSHKNTDRPNYFGMGTDEIDEKRTGRTMVLGYAGGSAGSCVRQMKSEDYVGEPTDVEGYPDLFNESVERKNGRTIIHFTVEQHVGRNPLEINSFFGGEQVSARTMWAIGGLEGTDCDAEVQFHRARGVSPFSWFNMNPTCFLGDEDELDVNAEGGEVSV
jgi:hypothetical protein